MQLNGRTVWQQAGGDKDRNYVKICLDWGVILNGPGKFGNLETAHEKYNESLSKKKVTGLTRFAFDMKAGDIVVLRLGTNEAHAVGEIVGDYQWNDMFGDIDGWDLQHVRRVKWLWKCRETPDDLGTYAFKQGDTTQQANTEAVLGWLRSLRVHTTVERCLPTLPKVAGNRLDMADVAQGLFNKGMDSSSVDMLANKLDELVRISEWYDREELVPSEHETVCLLVVPFLRAIGWTPQKMGVEWNYVDIAMFGRLPRAAENLQFVLEAKKRNRSCLTALSQAQRYAEDHDCRRLIVTDGIRYGIYDHHYKFKLAAYMNLARLMDAYPILDCGGAIEAIWKMSPET